jgi:hypothetical protein
VPEEIEADKAEQLRPHHDAPGQDVSGDVGHHLAEVLDLQVPVHPDIVLRIEGRGLGPTGVVDDPGYHRGPGPPGFS